MPTKYKVKNSSTHTSEETSEQTSVTSEDTSDQTIVTQSEETTVTPSVETTTDIPSVERETATQTNALPTMLPTMLPIVDKLKKAIEAPKMATRKDLIKDFKYTAIKYKSGTQENEMVPDPELPPPTPNYDGDDYKNKNMEAESSDDDDDVPFNPPSPELLSAMKKLYATKKHLNLKQHGITNREVGIFYI